MTSNEAQENIETEDIPSDFFDDFNKAEFIEGLSVIDSWDDEGLLDRPVPRINAEALDNVKDLRELIKDSKDKKDRNDGGYHNENKPYLKGSNNKKRSTSYESERFKTSETRRDPDKTNAAIKKDKDLKEKEYLTKKLESGDDIRPPGTELDEYYEENKKKRRHSPLKKVVETAKHHKSRSPRERVVKDSALHTRVSPHRYRNSSPRNREYTNRRRESPERRRVSPNSHRYRMSPSRHHTQSRRDSPNRRVSPLRRRASPYSRRHEDSRYSPRRFSPKRNSLQSRSKYSPHRSSPPRSSRRSRSPYHSSSKVSPRRSPNHRDSFLYPNTPTQAPYEVPQTFSLSTSWMPNQPVSSFPGAVTDYTYPSVAPPLAGYGAVYNAPYTTYAAPGPQPVPAPMPVPAPAAIQPVPVSSVPVAANNVPKVHSENKTSPYDALAQLLADGKITKEEYLKLTPNKGPGVTQVDLKEKVELLNRCHFAVTKLGKFHLPHKLIMHNYMIGKEQKTILPKFCSPLKRMPPVEFHFTQGSSEAQEQQNKKLIDSIVATIGLENVVTKSKKKDPKNMKSVAVQTTKPFCSICDLRDSMKTIDAGTSVSLEDFSVSVHTQVVEQDLLNSKTVFTPGGGIADGAPISIAHLTPAQLVSQLAAKAKTLKQDPVVDPSHQFTRRYPSQQNYDRGGGSYQNYNNYRY